MLTVLAVLLGSAMGSLGAAPAQATWGFDLGIGEQQAHMFSDPRFAALGLEHARVVVPYDVACHPSKQLYYVDVWLAAAQQAEVEPLVAFGISWRKGHRWKLPSYRKFLRCFRAFRARYPHVVEFNPWNEANHSSQPTFRHPKRAAGFYNAMRRACRDCTVAAGDLLDWSLMRGWFERYRPHLRGRVRLWSIHNYLDVNVPRPWRKSATYKLLRRTRGQLWITETGGVVHSGRYPGHDVRRAAAATRRMFAVARRSRRITRLYAYQWQATCDRDAWDSAWIHPDGSARPGYRVIVDELVRERGLDPAAADAMDPPRGPAMRDTCDDR
jgi:hypothetical protein